MLKFVLLALFVVGCNSNNMIKVALKPQSSTDTLDTTKIRYTNEFHILENLTTRLVSLDSNGNYQLELASSIDKISDNQVLIGIKKAYFSDGTIISLSDVNLSLNRSLQGTSHVQLSNYIENISIFHDKIKFVFKKPCKSFFYYLSLPDFGILHPSQYSKSSTLASDYKISSGPFYLSSDSSKMIKNKFYTLSPSNYPDEVILVNPLGQNTFDGLISQKVDVGQLSLHDFLKDYQKITQLKEYRLLGSPSDALTYILFNPNSKNQLKPLHKKWLQQQIFKHFTIPDDLSVISKKAQQYFPEESRAFISHNSLLETLGMDLVSKPEDFPNKIVIHTFTTAYKVTPEPLVRLIEKIEDLNIQIINDVKPENFHRMYKDGEIDYFLNIMSTDYRMPEEAINFEFFSDDSLMEDYSGKIRKLYDEYQATSDPKKEVEVLQEISRSMSKSGNFIPLYHATTPYFYNTTTIDLNGLSHLFVTNFWKMKSL